MKDFIFSNTKLTNMIKIIVFDSNQFRNQTMNEQLRSVNGIDVSIFKQFDGSNGDSLGGYWLNHDEKFKTLVANADYLFIHSSNDLFDGAYCTLKSSKLKAIVYSGGGVKDNQVAENIFIVNDKIIEGTEWDLISFAGAVLNNDANPIGKLFGFDTELEELLKPFEASNPFETIARRGEELKQAKEALKKYIKAIS